MYFITEMSVSYVKKFMFGTKSTSLRTAVPESTIFGKFQHDRSSSKFKSVPHSVFSVIFLGKKIMTQKTYFRINNLSNSYFRLRLAHAYIINTPDVFRYYLTSLVLHTICFIGHNKSNFMFLFSTHVIF